MKTNVTWCHLVVAASATFFVLTTTTQATAQYRGAFHHKHVGKKQFQGSASMAAISSRYNMQNRPLYTHLPTARYSVLASVSSRAWLKVFGWKQNVVNIQAHAQAKQGTGNLPAAYYNGGTRNSTSLASIFVRIQGKTILSGHDARSVALQKTKRVTFHSGKKVVFAGPVPITIRYGVGGGITFKGNAGASIRSGGTTSTVMGNRVFRVPAPDVVHAGLYGAIIVYANGWGAAAVGVPYLNLGPEIDLRFAHTTVSALHNANSTSGLSGAVTLAIRPIVLRFKLCARIVKKWCWTFAKTAAASVRKQWTMR